MANPSPQTKGGKPDKLIRDALMAAIRQGPEKLKQGAEKIIDQFAAGDLEAAKFVADRVDGKAIQPINHGFSQEPATNESVDAQLTYLAGKAGIAFVAATQARAKDEGELSVVH